MLERQTIALVILLGSSVVVNVLMHWLVVCRALYKHGARFPTGLLFWRVFHELRRYKDLLSAQGRPLTPHSATFVLTWFNLLLALGVALRVLWEQTHPLR